MSSSSIFYDDERNVYIDLDTGLEIPVAAKATKADNNNSRLPNVKEIEESPRFVQETKGDDDLELQIKRDHELALQLAANEIRPVSTSPSASPRLSSKDDNQLCREVMSLDLQREEEAPPVGWHREDWTLARALQAMEIEVAQDFDRGVEFENTEKHAGSALKQLFTFSTLVSISQVIMLGIMGGMYGLAPMNINPMIGPYSYILVRFGAKELSVMMYKNEWWRLITAIFINAGVWQLLSNVFIQVCSYPSHILTYPFT